MRIQLVRGETMPLRDGQGRTVRAHAGRIWLTEENGSDVFLEPGESFRLAGSGLAVVEAFSDASISIA